MTAISTPLGLGPEAFPDDETRWQAVISRNSAAVGAFYFSVRTTGVYCRPDCASRLARRENVRFHETSQDAVQAGFRPCKRCRPQEKTLGERQAALVAQACRTIESAAESPSLDALAKSTGLSRHHFHRVFVAHTGVTPKAYADAHRGRRVRSELTRSATVTEAIYRAGFESNSRFYESSAEILGMTPTEFRRGGTGTTLRFAVGECSLGSFLVAASDKGVCAIFLGDDPEELVRELQDQFPGSHLVGGDDSFDGWVARVVGLMDEPAVGLDLPLDIRGTAFQVRVWEALMQIPPGSTASYGEIAKRIGQPRAARAVALACASNSIAGAIPCHRVVRTDASLSGYRWGVQRKATLLERERTTECEAGRGDEERPTPDPPTHPSRRAAKRRDEGASSPG